jgi:hypothetical protein
VLQMVLAALGRQLGGSTEAGLTDVLPPVAPRVPAARARMMVKWREDQSRWRVGRRQLFWLLRVLWVVVFGFTSEIIVF